MPSRWQRRSQEEKEKILADAREREKPGKPPFPVEKSENHLLSNRKKYLYTIEYYYLSMATEKEAVEVIKYILTNISRAKWDGLTKVQQDALIDYVHGACTGLSKPGTFRYLVYDVLHTHYDTDFIDLNNAKLFVQHAFVAPEESTKATIMNALLESMSLPDGKRNEI